MSTVFTGFSFYPIYVDALEELAEFEDRNKSVIMRRALEAYYENSLGKKIVTKGDNDG